MSNEEAAPKRALNVLDDLDAAEQRDGDRFDEVVAPRLASVEDVTIPDGASHRDVTDPTAGPDAIAARPEGVTAPVTLPALAPRPTTLGAHGLQFTRHQLDTLKRTVCKGSDDDEFQFFLYVCERSGLNPFVKQIYAVRRWDRQQRREVMAIQVGIDGFRLIAERTGKYLGQTEPMWCGQDGVWRDVWLSNEVPAAAKVGVYRLGAHEPIWAVARFDAYAQMKKDGSLTEIWARMPDVMIAKCAESLALRKAFPQELSGLYSSEEMAQAANHTTQTATPETLELVETMLDELVEAGVTDDAGKAAFRAKKWPLIMASENVAQEAITYIQKRLETRPAKQTSAAGDVSKAA